MLSPQETAFLRYRAAGQSDRGQVRQRNEDRFSSQKNPTLYIVSDGMGGQQGGEVASHAVITVLPQLIQQRFAQLKEHHQLTEASIKELLSQSIFDLSQNVRAGSKGVAGLKGMGATVVLVLPYRGCAYLAHMGDSRIYLFRKGKLILQTEDHSVIMALQKYGDIKSGEDVSHHPARGKLSRFVGMEEDVYPDVQTLSLEFGDRLLLCTDGLSGMVSYQTIAQILLDHPYPDPKPTCEALIRAANDAGGKDNVTVLLIDCIDSRKSKQEEVHTT